MEYEHTWLVFYAIEVTSETNIDIKPYKTWMSYNHLKRSKIQFFTKQG